MNLETITDLKTGMVEFYQGGVLIASWGGGAAPDDLIAEFDRIYKAGQLEAEEKLLEATEALAYVVETAKAFRNEEANGGWLFALKACSGRAAEALEVIKGAN